MEKYIQLENGTFMPRLGMGTWFLGEDLHTRESEKEAYACICSAQGFGDCNTDKQEKRACVRACKGMGYYIK